MMPPNTGRSPKTEDTPRTLTQMYTHFLRFQIQQSRRKYDGEYTQMFPGIKMPSFHSGKLAFDQLERNNVIFYDTDLEACGIDVYKASVYSGMCTQIFKEETGIVLGTMYCFVHLSIQEFIAALYAHLFLDINKKYVFDRDSTEQETKVKPCLICSRMQWARCSRVAVVLWTISFTPFSDCHSSPKIT